MSTMTKSDSEKVTRLMHSLASVAQSSGSARVLRSPPPALPWLGSDKIGAWWSISQASTSLHPLEGSTAIMSPAEPLATVTLSSDAAGSRLDVLAAELLHIGAQASCAGLKELLEAAPLEVCPLFA